MLRAVSASFWCTAFLCYSSTITTPFPSPFMATIYKPSLLYLGCLTLFLTLHVASPFLPLNLTLQPFLPFPSSPLPLPFSSFPFLPSSFLLLCPLLSFSLCPPLLLYMPIICPHSCCICCVLRYIELYRLCYPRRSLWRNHSPRLYSCHAWRNNNCVVLLGGSRLNQWRAF